jgi:uncharacterized protein (TIGR03435 family)
MGKLAGATLIGGVVSVLAGSMQAAQSPSPAGQRFSVVSVKPCTEDFGPQARGGGASFSPGGMTLNCQLASAFIEMAYVIYANGTQATDPSILFSTPIDGGPGWITAERYTISASVEGSASQGTMRGPMLRALLEDRFKLRIRRETRETDVLALTIARGGHKLQPFQEGSCFRPPPPEPGAGGGLGPPLPPPPPAGQRYCRPDPTIRLSPAEQIKAVTSSPNVVVDLEGFTVEEFMRTLNGSPFVRLGRRVIDRTGLTGKFNLRLEYARPAPPRPENAELLAAAGEPTAPAIETALQDQLGLKLEPAKAPGDRLVIESIERPSAN